MLGCGARCQVNLEWLDLSFNNIARIEGLETLTKLTDLTLFNNNIQKLEGLNTLSRLQVLSVGALCSTCQQRACGLGSTRVSVACGCAALSYTTLGSDHCARSRSTDGR